jgi:hypothetical protein
MVEWYAPTPAVNFTRNLSITNINTARVRTPTHRRPTHPKMSNKQSPDPKTMQNPVEDRFFDFSGLLATGMYSDAQVTVGDRVWKVHKNIMCQRSGYMREVGFRLSKAGESIPEELPFDTTEKWAELLLEFIYSSCTCRIAPLRQATVFLILIRHAGIKTIDDFSMEDCVDLSILGEDFRVDGMASYATTKLWDKLKGTLQCFSTIPRAGVHPEIYHGRKVVLEDMVFELDFRRAVVRAYERPGNASQLVLADFVWAARDELFGTPAIEALNIAHPLFGSHVLTTLNMGPQSPFLRFDRHLNCVFCLQCARLQVNRPRKHALQHSL